MDKLLQIVSVEKVTYNKSLWSALPKRIMSANLAVLILLSIAIPTLDQQNTNQKYEIDPKSESIIGQASDYFANDISLDQKTGDYVYKKDLLGQQLTEDKITVRGGQFTVTIKSDPKEGVSYYDPESTQTFTIKPKAELLSPRKVGNRIVIPSKYSSLQHVLSVQGNGVKEDIVVPQKIGDTFTETYTLDLPTSQEARMEADGSVGIYTGSDYLFGKISYGSDEDRKLVEEAQKNATKDKLVFSIPAPIIAQSGDKMYDHEAKIWFTLENNTLTVHASQLNELNYPISIDPSAVVTSAGDFALGNDEGDANMDPANAHFQRNTLDGGDITSWTTGNSLNTARSQAAVVAWGGRMYVLGGCTVFTVNVCSTATNKVEVASIPSGGVLGTFTYNSSNDVVVSAVPINRYAYTATAYNGYIYISGGLDSSATPSSAVYSAKILSNGDLGTWTAINSLPNTIFNSAVIATKGYLYVLGACGNNTAVFGYTGGIPKCSAGGFGDFYYAPILVNGTIGSWTATNKPNFAFQQPGTLRAQIHKGYIIIGSEIISATYNTTINPNGSLNTWVGNGSLINSQFIHSGYVYTSSGYYKILSAGIDSILGVYNLQTLSYQGLQLTSTAGCSIGGVKYAYSNSVYCVGGLSTTVDATTQRANFATAGAVGAQMDSPITSGNPNDILPSGAGMNDACMAVYDGYLYFTGGQSGGTPNNNVYSKAIVTHANLYNGSPWSPAATFTTARSGHTCQAISGYLYIIGGTDSASAAFTDIQYAPITSPGALGAFTTAKATLNTAGGGKVNIASAYNKNADGNTYLYVTGGCVGATPSLNCPVSSTVTGNVYVGQVSSNGDLCGYNAGAYNCGATYDLKSTTSDSARHLHATFIYKGYIYNVAGRTGSSNGTTTNTVCYNSIQSGGDLGGSWTCSSNTLPNAVAAFGSFVSNGQLYVLGGENINGNGTIQIYRSTLGSAGDLGTWTTERTLSTTCKRMASGISENDGILLSGNCLGTLSRRYMIITLNNGGPGGTSDYNNSGHTSLPAKRYGNVSVAYNGWLYTAGGIACSACSGDEDLQSSIIRAPIDKSTGSIGTWVDTDPSFSTARWGANLLAYNNKLYLLGGCTNLASHTCIGGSLLNDVQISTINSDGSLGSWAPSGNSFTTPRVNFGATVNAGYLYVAGGCTNLFLNTCSAFENTVLKSTIASDGSISSWSAITSFSTARHTASFFTYNNFIYIASGIGSSGQLYDMQYALIDSNGSISTGWHTEQFEIPRGLNGATGYGENGYINLITGGILNVSASIGNNGALIGGWSTGSWNKLGSLLLGYNSYGFARYDGISYIVGGRNFATPDERVFGAYSFTQPRFASYSRAIDTDIDTTPAKLVLGGTNTGNSGMPGTTGMGGINVSFRSMTSSATNQGSLQTVNPGLSNLLNSALNYTAIDSSDVSTGVARQYLLIFEFDESQTATYPDSSGNFSTISDFELYYHPATNRRLKGGKTFTNEGICTAPSIHCRSKSLDAPPR